MADNIGVSLSALLEALGNDFAELPPADSTKQQRHPRWTKIEVAARRIDASRRRRTFKRGPDTPKG